MQNLQNNNDFPLVISPVLRIALPFGFPVKLTFIKKFSNGKKIPTILNSKKIFSASVI